MGSIALHRLSVDQEQKIILVDAEIGESAPGIRHRCALQALLIGAGEQPRLILYLHFLLPFRQVVIVFLKYRRDVLDEILPAGEDEIAQGNHLFINDLTKGGIHLATLKHLLQQRVALHQQFAVGNELLEVFAIELGDDSVEKFATHLATAIDDVAVIRGDHHHWELTDMGAKPLVLFLVCPHRLVSILVCATHLRVILRLAVEKLPVNSEEIGIEAHRKHILSSKIAFAEGEIINSVEEIGFATAVFADNAVHILIECKLSLLVAFEIGNMYVF